MRTIQLMAIVMFLALTTIALAQIPSFEELDTNGDGYVSRSEAEVLPCLAENYDSIETRSENGLDHGEYRAAVAEFCQIDS